MRGSRKGLGGATRSGLAAVVLLAAFFAIASGAFAAKVNIVTQEKPLPANKPGVAYYETIQEGVNHAAKGTYVLIEPGVYKEEVLDEKHPGIWIRGMNRNEVILDGENKPKPGGSNGIEVYKTSNVWIENLTVRNFDRQTSSGPGGNEIWWNGGEGSEKNRCARLVGQVPHRLRHRPQWRLRDLHQQRDRRRVGKHLRLGHERLGDVPRSVSGMQGEDQQSHHGEQRPGLLGLELRRQPRDRKLEHLSQRRRDRAQLRKPG
jgi:hypothetical protein